MLVDRFAMSPYIRWILLPDIARGLGAVAAMLIMFMPMSERLDSLAMMAAMIMLAPLAWWVGGIIERIVYRCLASRLS